MIRSMTGFGSSSGVLAGMQLSVEVRSVNHRFFSPSLKLPSSFTRWEPEIRERLRQGIGRGHVTLVIRADRSGGSAPVLDEQRFSELTAQLRSLAERHGFDSVDIGAVLRLPGVVDTSGTEATLEEPEGLFQLVDVAMRQLAEMRTDEGRRLRDYLEQAIDRLTQSVDAVEQRAPARLVYQRDRLRSAVAELLDGKAVDEQRLAQEIAFLAEKLDVSEEISRLRGHIGAFATSVTGESGEPVGKRLGFLLQEMLREANTIGSKSADTELLQYVVAMKEELERLREQAENVE